jgi:hypothetical protein
LEVTLDAVHVALYAALIGAGAALISQFVAQGIVAFRDGQNRQRREDRTRSVFIALVGTARGAFYGLRGTLENARENSSYGVEEGIRLSVRGQHFERLAQPLRAALADYDVLRDLSSAAVEQVLVLDDALYWSTARVISEGAELERQIEAAGADDARRAKALKECWDMVERAIALVEFQANRALEPLRRK